MSIEGKVWKGEENLVARPSEPRRVMRGCVTGTLEAPHSHFLVWKRVAMGKICCMRLHCCRCAAKNTLTCPQNLTIKQTKQWGDGMKIIKHSSSDMSIKHFTWNNAASAAMHKNETLVSRFRVVVSHQNDKKRSKQIQLLCTIHPMVHENKSTTKNKQTTYQSNNGWMLDDRWLVQQTLATNWRWPKNIQHLTNQSPKNGSRILQQNN